MTTIPPAKTELPGAPFVTPFQRNIVSAHGVTDIGKVRSTNEDQFLIAELVRTLWVRQSSIPQPDTQFSRNRGHLLLVADGMGGHHAGEVASALGVATVEAFVLNVLHRFSNLAVSDEQSVVKDFQAALQRADERICQESILHPEYSGMGTTMTLAFISDWRLFVMHAGDSRCYLFRDRHLMQLTRDHSVAAELARRGLISTWEANRHRYRHVVTNVLGGDQSGVQVEIHQEELRPGDVLLLCSDGLHDLVSTEQIVETLLAEPNPELACARLVAQANLLGGPDNITAIVAHCRPATVSS